MIRTIFQRSVLPLLLFLPTLLSATILKGKGWQAELDERTGRLVNFKMVSSGKSETVPFRQDTMGGPTIDGVAMRAASGELNVFVGQKNGVEYRLEYVPMEDHLAVVCKVKNNGRQSYEPERLRLRIGADAEMKTFPDWDKKYFPTLMRCEKTHAWGYLMSPKGGILALGVDAPVASYQLNYIYEGLKAWYWGHQVFTESFDLLHKCPLPARHPQDQTSLAAGESRCWTLHLGGAKNLEEVKPLLAHWLNVPMLEASRYTVVGGENVRVKIFADEGGTWYALNEQGKKLPGGKYGANATVKLTMPNETGVKVYRFRSRKGKESELSLFVRHSWDWYLDKARDWAAQYPPMAGGSAEQYYGYYAAALGAKHLPDKEKDMMLESKFRSRILLMIDTLTGKPMNKHVLPYRIQNFATMIGLLVDYWETTGKTEYLRWASRLGDFFMSDTVQWADGSYRSRKTHYTSVIYPAKSMMELALAEEKAAKTNPIWAEKAKRHLASAHKAAEDLARRLDDIETEGDLTFEDGMISCSALQMGLCGLLSTDVGQRERMTDGAKYMMEKHRCLEQLLIPDCRMRGATLRYWEALDLYFSPNQVMNSPHGWTAWKIYAVYYLYLLTGDVKYLHNLMDTMGACVEVVDKDGRLRWGFLPDPYVDGYVAVSKKDNPREWERKDSIVGEQYMDMISSWCRPEDENQLYDFGNSGGSGDNTVYEIFKSLEECVLENAFVTVDKKGRVETWNCRVRRAGKHLFVDSSEPCVKRLVLCSEGKLDIQTDLEIVRVGDSQVKNHKEKKQ